MSEAIVTGSRKSKTAAYLWWFFFGGFGAHKFYLGRSGAGGFYLVCTLGIWALMFARLPLAALAPSLILGVALLIDLFTIPGQVRAANGSSAGEPAEPGKRRPMFAAPADEPFDAAGADAAIARYVRERSAPRPANARAGAARPSFGRR